MVEEGPGVVSLRIAGRRLDRLGAEPGQFFLWRFLDRRRIWSAHPFSLSAAPDGQSLRITVKALGDHTARLGGVRPGTRVLAEGPFGVFTESARRRREKVLLIAGGIGITPIRSMVERMRGDVVVLYRALADGDLVFKRRARRPRRANAASPSTTSSATTAARARGCSRPSTCASSCPTRPNATSSSAARRR